MKLIDGKGMADGILSDIRMQISRMFRAPGLAIVLVGDDPASHTYVKLKEQAASRVGMHFEKFVHPADADETSILETISELNAREDIHGIIVQLPLPKNLPTDRIIEHIAPEKDVDGFHPENLRLLSLGRERLVPSLVRSVMRLIQSTNFAFEGARTAIIANSDTFAKPFDIILQKKGMKVDTCLPPFIDSEPITRSADLIIIAIGRPGFLTRSVIKKNAVLVDVGFTREKDGTVRGDIDRASVEPVAGWLTPVPGGVGPMTVAMLLANTLDACRLQTV